MLFFVKILFASALISFCSWLSGKKPELAGFIIALPIASIIAIIFSYYEHKNLENTIIFAKSILIAIPASYLFFLPFFWGDKLGVNFWVLIILGIILLIVGYFFHKLIINYFF